MDGQNSPLLLTPKEAADMLRVSERWLARGRLAGFGPLHVACGHRTVRYTRESLNDFVASRTRRSTSDIGHADAAA